MRNLVDFRFNTDVNIYKRDLNQSNLITYNTPVLL